MMLAAASLLAFEEVNILLDVNFEGEANAFPGMLGPWNVDSEDSLVNPMVVLKGEGPEGRNALRINIPYGEVFRQQNVALVAGEKYRFGAYVRTKGLQTPTSSIYVWNRFWTGEIKSRIEVPRDTDGKWVKVEGEGVLPKSVNGVYTYGLYAKTPKGTIDIACPYLIPLSEKALAGSKAMGQKKITLNRIVPVYPLLRKIDVANPQLSFYIPGLSNNKLGECELGVQTKMAGEEFFSPWGIFDIDASRLVKTNLGGLPLGEGTMRVAVFERDTRKVVLQNEYAFRVINVPPKANLKRLNNMVSEILVTDLKDGEITFDNPCEGWVFIGFDKPYPNTTARLDGAAEPVVRFREGELSDTMRLLPLGKHTLKIENAPAAGGKLIVRAVAQIMLYRLNIAEKTDFNNFRYDMDFFKKHLLHSVNLFDTESWLPKTDFELYIDRDIASRGMKIVGSRGLFRAENEMQIDKMVKAIRENPSLNRNWGLTLDELSLSSNPIIIESTSDALWKMTDMEKRVYLWCCSVESNTFSNPRIHHNLLSAGSNVSRSEGKIFLETYVGTRRTEEQLNEYLKFVPRHLEVARKLAPDAAERFMMLMSGYTTPEVWCINNYPAADIKVVFDRFFNILANDPRMDGLYGMGCYSIAHTDEELVRWIGRLMRYYCVEGGKASLAEKYGFNYIPGHLKDGDFEEGFKHWKAEPAEEGSLVHKTVNGYGGVGIQWRIGREPGLGDNVALFTKSDKKPNLLSQTATGLTPGKLYCLTFMSVDYNDLSKPQNKHLEFVFDATVSDADIIPEATSMRRYPQVWGGNGDYKPGTPEKAIRRIVFRAKKDKAVITFSDWKSATEPGGPAGQKRVVNWIGLNPYYQD